MTKFEYHDQQNTRLKEKTKDILDELPKFCRDYYNSKHSLTVLSRYTYLLRIQTFLNYAAEEGLVSKDIKQITTSELDGIRRKDINAFITALQDGSVNPDGHKESPATISNYLSGLNSLWDYLEKESEVDINIIKHVERPPVKEESKDRKYLDQNDQKMVFNAVLSGFGLSEHSQKLRTDVSVARDCAIYITLLHTGLRVSELVGLDLEHVYLYDEKNGIMAPFIKVLRKEGYLENVYLSNEANEAIAEYIALRPTLLDVEEKENSEERALFLGTTGTGKGKRLTVRSVQRLVKKYAEAGAPMIGSHITPHRIRASYATTMINKTGDLSLVQQLMSHKSPATTSIYIDDRTEARKLHRNDMQE